MRSSHQTTVIEDANVRHARPWGRPALGSSVAAGAIAGAIAAGWAVRGRSSSVFGPNVWHGNRASKAIALTFDDGPSNGTPKILKILAESGTPATFFQCGANVEALPAIARQVTAEGHELGNHSFTHPLCVLKSKHFIADEFSRAQTAIIEATGTAPRLLRAPFGVRWFGFDRVPLTSVMWDVIALDWKLRPAEIARRLVRRTRNGSILCLHDGRLLNRSQSIESTVEALRWTVPQLLDRGFEFRTVSQLLCPNPSPTKPLQTTS